MVRFHWARHTSVFSCLCQCCELGRRHTRTSNTTREQDRQSAFSKFDLLSAVDLFDQLTLSYQQSSRLLCVRSKRGRTRDSSNSCSPCGKFGYTFFCVHLGPERIRHWHDSWICLASWWKFSWSSLVSTRRSWLCQFENTSSEIHRTTRRAVRTQSLFGLAFTCDNWCLYFALLQPQWLRHLSPHPSCCNQ